MSTNSMNMDPSFFDPIVAFVTKLLEYSDSVAAALVALFVSGPLMLILPVTAMIMVSLAIMDTMLNDDILHGVKRIVDIVIVFAAVYMGLTNWVAGANISCAIRSTIGTITTTVAGAVQMSGASTGKCGDVTLVDMAAKAMQASQDAMTNALQKSLANTLRAVEAGDGQITIERGIANGGDGGGQQAPAINATTGP